MKVLVDICTVLEMIWKHERGVTTPGYLPKICGDLTSDVRSWVNDKEWRNAERSSCGLRNLKMLNCTWQLLGRREVQKSIRT